MHADARKLLWDAQQAAERIARFTAGKSFTDYEADEYLRSAVERQFEIVGEAINQLRRIDPETATAIPELPRVIAFRNILVHRYANVDNRLVWGVLDSITHHHARRTSGETVSTPAKRSQEISVATPAPAP